MKVWKKEELNALTPEEIQAMTEQEALEARKQGRELLEAERERIAQLQTVKPEPFTYDLPEGI